jgi:hypothetical protein
VIALLVLGAPTALSGIIGTLLIIHGKRGQRGVWWSKWQ